MSGPCFKLIPNLINISNTHKISTNSPKRGRVEKKENLLIFFGWGKKWEGSSSSGSRGLWRNFLDPRRFYLSVQFSDVIFEKQKIKRDPA